MTEPTPAPPTGHSHWLAVATPIVGLVAIILSLVPATVRIGLALGVAAVALGAVGLGRKVGAKAALIVGLVLGAASVTIALVSANASQEPESAPVMVYKASSVEPATVTYYVKGKRQTETFKGEWEATMEVVKGSYVMLTVEENQDLSFPSPIECELVLNGTSVHSSQGLGWAFCSVKVETE